ncbi:MAG: sensor histidine kinase [Halobacteriota archaeon]
MDETGDTTDQPQAAWLEDASVAERCCAFVDSTTDIFTHIRSDGEMTYVTDTEEMLGRSRKEFLETSLVEYIHPNDSDRAIAAFESALEAESTASVELRFRHGDGHWIWIESSCSPIPSEYDLEGVVTVTRDITERKRREEELEATKAKLERSNEKLRRQNRRLDRFASVVSHDLLNPLSVAAGRLRLARAVCDNEHLEAMAKPLDRMAQMIDTLQTLTMSQHRTVTTAPVSIADRATAAWETTETADSTLRVLLDPDTEYAADLRLLDHVFENLFRNAVVHNESPVTVTVGSLVDRPGFYVADDGTGIPSDRIDDVLEYGYSIRNDGTGVGLAIVSEFVEAHGWELAITTGEDGGACFEIHTAGHS